MHPARRLSPLFLPAGLLALALHGPAAGQPFEPWDAGFEARFPRGVRPPAALSGPETLWTWTLLPDDLLFSSYLGSPTEPRLTSAWLYDTDSGWLWDFTVGARVGLLRLGAPVGGEPSGWQLDLWGAAFPRLNMEQDYDLDATDFALGLPLTWRQGPFQSKVEVRHLSSHVGDEFLLRNPGFARHNYVRDALAAAVGWFPNPDVRLYAEAEYAFHRDGGAEPWHFQFGVDYSPVPSASWLGWSGTPFAAVNAQLREEAEFGGGVTVIGGWQWRGPESRRLLRVGAQYYNGKSYQFSFFDRHEQLLGIGLWYDY